MLSVVKKGVLCVQCVSEVADLADWILDVTWLYWKDSDNFEVAIVTAHNVLTCYAVVKGVSHMACYRSEVSCILYPMMTNSYLAMEILYVASLTFSEGILH